MNKVRWDLVFCAACACVVAVAFIGAVVEKSGLVVRALPLFVAVAVILAGVGIVCALKYKVPSQGDSNANQDRSDRDVRAAAGGADRAAHHGADQDGGRKPDGGQGDLEQRR